MNESLKKKIEERAYQLFLKRGGVHGYHVEDWARAEKEVLAEDAAQKPSGSWKPAAQTAAPAAPKPAQAKSRKR
jgi:hypothetical protein